MPSAANEHQFEASEDEMVGPDTRGLAAIGGGSLRSNATTFASKFSSVLARTIKNFYYIHLYISR